MLELQYPIGKHKRLEGTLPINLREDYISAIRDIPKLLKKAVENFSESQLDTPYRPGGWTVRQLLHHMADSHMNSFFRFKLALTEDNPTIKPYEEQLWAQTPEIYSVPVSVSLQLLELLHIRWVALLKGIDPEKYKSTFQHPVSGTMTLDQAIALYAWHGKHHLAHILRLIERNNW
ncbi:MAG: putative metal-dependent hydrolase [Bacteroidota bacterium]|nr:putative metal-dependent hydrolase [Bacteroidota bacterium]